MLRVEVCGFCEPCVTACQGYVQLPLRGAFRADWDLRPVKFARLTGTEDDLVGEFRNANVKKLETRIQNT